MVTTDNGTIDMRTNIGDNNSSDGLGTIIGTTMMEIMTGPRPGLIRH
jgi:hypothetical protein